MWNQFNFVSGEKYGEYPSSLALEGLGACVQLYLGCSSHQMTVIRELVHPWSPRGFWFWYISQKRELDPADAVFFTHLSPAHRMTAGNTTESPLLVYTSVGFYLQGVQRNNKIKRNWTSTLNERWTRSTSLWFFSKWWVFLILWSWSPVQVLSDVFSFHIYASLHLS